MLRAVANPAAGGQPGSFTSLTATSLTVTGNAYLATTSGNVGIGTTSPASFAGYTGATLNNATNGSFVHLQTGGVTKVKLETTPTGNYLSTEAGQGALILNPENTAVISVAPGSATITGYWAGTEQTAPAAPAANGYRIFAQDNGAGKTQLMVIFATGAAQQIAIEP